MKLFTLICFFTFVVTIPASFANDQPSIRAAFQKALAENPGLFQKIGALVKTSYRKVDVVGVVACTAGNGDGMDINHRGFASQEDFYNCRYLSLQSVLQGCVDWLTGQGCDTYPAPFEVTVRSFGAPLMMSFVQMDLFLVAGMFYADEDENTFDFGGPFYGASAGGGAIFTPTAKVGVYANKRGLMVHLTAGLVGGMVNATIDSIELGY